MKISLILFAAMTCGYLNAEQITTRQTRENQYVKIPVSVGKYRFENFKDHETFAIKARKRLMELTGLELMHRMPEVPLAPVTIWKREFPEGKVEKIQLTYEEGENGCIYIGIPKERKYQPAFICLQGHSTGMHRSLEVAWEDEITPIDGNHRGFLRDAMRYGITAVAVEQRYMGERSTHADHTPSCLGAVQALMIGRTGIGERVYDIERVMKYLKSRSELKINGIGVMGTSGGGTAALFAGALIPEIQYVMPGCCFSTFRASIGGMEHCPCNHIPNILFFGELGDIAGLCAPRTLFIVNGSKDPVFPIKPAQEEFKRVEKIFEAAGAKDKCRLLIGDGGHTYFSELSWKNMCEVLPEL